MVLNNVYRSKLFIFWWPNTETYCPPRICCRHLRKSCPHCVCSRSDDYIYWSILKANIKRLSQWFHMIHFLIDTKCFVSEWKDINGHFQWILNSRNSTTGKWSQTLWKCSNYTRSLKTSPGFCQVIYIWLMAMSPSFASFMCYTP